MIEVESEQEDVEVEEEEEEAKLEPEPKRLSQRSAQKTPDKKVKTPVKEDTSSKK